MARYLTELVGTFFLTLTVGMTAVMGLAEAPLAVGGVLVALVYMGGHVSGAHYNPAVSVAICLRGNLAAGDLLPYLIAQLAGAALAGLAVLALATEPFAPAPAAGAALGSVLLAEALLTFALVLVILNVATHPATEGNAYYGLAIGLTVLGGAYAVGPVSGGVFNPAVGMGPILIDVALGGGTLAHAWIYVAAPVVGGLAALPVFRMQLAVAGEE